MPDSSKFEIFRDSDNLYQRIGFRKRPILIGAVLFCLVLAGNLWWLAATLTRPYLEEELEEHAKSSAMRAQATQRLDAKTREIEEGMERLQAGDSKLREMIRLDKEAKQAAQGGDTGEQKFDPKALLTRMDIQAAFIRALNRPVRMATTDGETVIRLLSSGPLALGTAPDAWPVQGVISSEFGMRLSPFAGQEEFHQGVDIMAPAGSSVRAPAPGIVTFAGVDAEGTQTVVLDHGGGYVTIFSHMQRLEARPGEKVERGQDIGMVGQEGRATGPHLHYEVRLHGVPVDPKKYLS